MSICEIAGTGAVMKSMQSLQRQAQPIKRQPQNALRGGGKEGAGGKEGGQQK